MASGTLSPTAKLVAPQITCCSPEPVFTRQYRIGFLNSVSSSISATWPTITPEISCPTGSTDSTSRPAAVSRRAISAGSVAGSTAAYSSSHESGTRITPPFRTPG